ncbi:MAG: heavy-metal-associated domain-containing protein [Acidiferrobacterales bacterium]
MIRTGATILVLAMLFVPLGAYAAPNIYELQVDGLACPFCAYGIEKKLNAIDGVEKVDVELKKGAVVVTMTEGTALTETQAREAVKDAGFTLRGFLQIHGEE